MYKPTPGFFDITNCPKGLGKRTHEKMQEIQMFLAHVQSKSAYYREFNRPQWEKAKEMSGQLQQMIFQHYPHDELFVYRSLRTLLKPAEFTRNVLEELAGLEEPNHDT